MRFRFPRLRRRGGTLPAHQPDGDTQPAAVSPSRYRCPNCQRVCGLAPIAVPTWVLRHDCTPCRHYFDLGTNIGDTDEWLSFKGYAWEPVTDDVNDGLRLTRTGHPDVIAPMGSVLLWDGEEVTVEQPGPIEEIGD